MDSQQSQLGAVEAFSSSDTQFLKRFVTNTDKPVFALINLPEVVKGALFARYSRSSKSLRRLLLDEFREDVESYSQDLAGRAVRAESFYHRVFSEFGDDSIAQLGTVHVACEGISNVATKLVERGRLMSYLEQSTRYIPYTDQPGGAWKYYTPSELMGELRDDYRRAADKSFSTYASLLPQMETFLSHRFAVSGTEGEPAIGRAIRAKALDLLRGLLPAATRSNVGVFGSGQSYELLVMRLRACGNTEAAALGDLILAELQKVVPSFVSRVDRPDRGVVWTQYLRETRESTEAVASRFLEGAEPAAGPDVGLVDFDPDGELKVIAAALYPYSHHSDRHILEVVRRMSETDRLAILSAFSGDRVNRRHKPGRALERTSYRFEIVSDYGAFRDLQRHRMLSMDWQTLSVCHGYDTPDLVEEAGFGSEWRSVMEDAAAVHEALVSEYSLQLASYVVPMAYRVRYFMDMNAREAMHVIELRSSPQGHESYRQVAMQMHSLIADVAGHRALAKAIGFANHEDHELERLKAERLNDSQSGS